MSQTIHIPKKKFVVVQKVNERANKKKSMIIINNIISHLFKSAQTNKKKIFGNSVKNRFGSDALVG